jgi:hypothetical protein
LGVQRAISFVPGVNIEYSAAENAKGSIEWRVEIWKYCLDQAPKYLLIGRGSTFDVMETAAGLGVNDVRNYSPFFAFQTRSYHSGPLAMLIDYGIPGLLVGSWLAVVLFVRFWKYAGMLGRYDTLESRFALYYCAFMLWQIVAFYLVYGSMVKFSNTIIAMSSFALVLVKSFSYQKDSQKPDSQTMVKALNSCG